MGKILFLVGMFSCLAGCLKQENYGPWQSLDIYKTSSVLTQSYHFTVSKEANGSMTIQGFCFDNEKEYRLEEKVLLSEGVAEALLGMKLEMVSTQKSKPKIFDVADEVQMRCTLTNADGTQRNIAISDEMQQELITLLKTEMIHKTR